MKVNKDSFVLGSKVLLVPYKRHHVLKYHKWMQSEELQTLTASEPLSLEEEYDMQKKWQEDEDKCTFIVLDLLKYKNGQKKQEDNEIDSMIGDVNLFLNDVSNRKNAEIEIMIAEETYRGKGLGKEALLSMMRYGVEVLHLDRITAKIGYDNKPSICMFMKLGFTEVSRSDIFQEVTLELNIMDGVRVMIEDDTPHFKIEMKG
ncbi:N-acetyltransferase 9-like protein isoform X2 [Gigantopelta aegis]|uniref:N-acetyltransferase 9-like protein isoform X2 n=1 Tax=Gigantopelta aegis TaxID=1735272 RepID=UPI001B88E218|nr:N-acetyltransferase 9-like protein isoform X2 [Gigantopelta aegis]XP_041364873.1 N-acetyltransferase 9-like protein isoform X2 [Gigantopelta aegis]